MTDLKFSYVTNWRVSCITQAATAVYFFVLVGWINQ